MSWESLKLEFYIVHRAPSIVRLFLKSGSHDPVEGFRCRDRVRLGFHNRGDQARLADAIEGLLHRHHFIQDGSEREDIRPRVDIAALELFGRHIAKRA